MRGRSLLVCFLALLGLLALAPPTHAAVALCATADAQDPQGDVAGNPNVVPDQLNHFNRLDIRSICFTDTADATLVVVTIGEAVGSDQVTSFAWTFHYKPNNGTEQTVRYSHANGAATSAPAGNAQSEGTRIEFKVARSASVPVGTPLAGMFVNSTGRFVDPQGVVFSGSDRAPDGTAALPFVYKVGARSPAGTDTDKDGVDDSVEVADGTDPNKADSDGDGLSDQQEKKAGSNPLKKDSDGDGLSDSEEVNGKASIGGSEVSFDPTDPTRPDTDGDGLGDRDEVTGSQNSIYTENAYVQSQPGSTNPDLSDTDGDGLTDGEELAGAATVEGTPKNFAPTNPNNQDTDGDGLTDFEELRGYRVTPNGVRVEFSPTDPTRADTDGDGINDNQEIQTHHDPADPNDKPANGPVSDIAQYLPVSGALLLLVVFVSLGGILWRWA